MLFRFHSSDICLVESQNAPFVQHFQVFGYTNVATSTCSRRLLNGISVHVNRVNVESELLDDNRSLLVTRETLRAFLQMK